ncbi:hypothetical protein MRX96_006447 [Rhipicephalus microplus]
MLSRTSFFTPPSAAFSDVSTQGPSSSGSSLRKSGAVATRASNSFKRFLFHGPRLRAGLRQLEQTIGSCVAALRTQVAVDMSFRHELCGIRRPQHSHVVLLTPCCFANTAATSLREVGAFRSSGHLQRVSRPQRSVECLSDKYETELSSPLVARQHCDREIPFRFRWSGADEMPEPCCFDYVRMSARSGSCRRCNEFGSTSCGCWTGTGRSSIRRGGTSRPLPNQLRGVAEDELSATVARTQDNAAGTSGVRHLRK